MALSASSGGNELALAPGLRNIQNGEELKGALEALLMPKVGAERAGEYAALLVSEGLFDSSATIADLAVEDLKELGVMVGHRKVILRVVYGGLLPAVVAPSVPVTPMAGAPPAPAPAAAPAEGGLHSAPTFKREWPKPKENGLLSAAEFKQFGLAIRGHLLDVNKMDLAHEMWRRFENPTSSIL